MKMTQRNSLASTGFHLVISLKEEKEHVKKQKQQQQQKNKKIKK